jgi:ceramide glucosyltransferase
LRSFALLFTNPAVVLNAILGTLALLSLALVLWQWVVARRFPLHQRRAFAGLAPGITLLKSLKGCDPSTESCLRSWFIQDYPGPIQILFGVASAEDPVCEVVRRLIKEFPKADAELIVCGPLLGANLKVSKLAQIERRAKHDLLLVSDADVLVPPDLLVNVVPLLGNGADTDKRAANEGLATSGAGQPKAAEDCTHSKTLRAVPARVGLVTCFYRLANPTTPAMHWEAVAINADFWSQVLQAQSLKPVDFALGAVMLTRRTTLAEVGGFAALADCLADDYQLGNRLARRGYRIALSPVVVECRSEPMGWRAVWKHQLRWARTIRVCQPAPYFFSLLNNGTLWPLLWLAANPSAPVFAFAVFCCLVRVATALDLQRRIGPRTELAVRGQEAAGPDSEPAACSSAEGQGAGIGARVMLPLFKDLLQAGIWLLAFTGNRIEWRGERFRLKPDGTLVRINGKRK